MHIYWNLKENFQPEAVSGVNVREGKSQNNDGEKRKVKGKRSKVKGMDQVLKRESRGVVLSSSGPRWF
jgi:hypothetical protein